MEPDDAYLFGYCYSLGLCSTCMLLLLVDVCVIVELVMTSCNATLVALWLYIQNCFFGLMFKKSNNVIARYITLSMKAITK
jgi:hypothetical protein